MKPEPGQGMSASQQIEYWMDRYFRLLDEHAESVNALAAIAAIVNRPSQNAETQ